MDTLDSQWLSLNLFEAMEKLGVCAKRLRTIACQKSVPKRETIERWVSFGELHREHLESLLADVNAEYRFVDADTGQDYGLKKTKQFLEMFDISLEFYADARDRALKRLKKPKKQFYAGF